MNCQRCAKPMLTTGHDEVEPLTETHVIVCLVVLHECQSCGASLTDRRPFVLPIGEYHRAL